jgi:uncharacterized protein (TIGR00725 family)
MRPLIISVIGAGKPDTDSYKLAEEIGSELARRNVITACGGLAGIMEAVWKGAHMQGGLTIGILPRNSRNEANQYVDIAIPTGLGIVRNALVVKTGEAVIALDGEYGTLSEIAIALAEQIPVISLKKWVLPNDMHRNIIWATNPVNAVEKAIGAIGRSKQGEEYG